VYIHSMKFVLRLHVLGYFTEKWLDFMKNITFGLESLFVWFRYRELSFTCGTEITWGSCVALVFVVQYF
jgi:hypothetical protein